MDIKKSSVFILVVFCKYVSCYLRVCYYTNWSQYRPEGGRFLPDNVDPTLCTHIIFAFAKLNGTNLAPIEWNDESSAGTIGMYEQINIMKKRNPALKTLLAVGGWNAGSLPFSDLVASRKSRQAFVNSTLVYLRERNFNGLDLDWEYPASRGGRPADKQNLVALLSELRRAFEQESYHTGKERLLLTCAVPAGKSNIDAGYDVPNIARSLDFINIMTYDMHGSWETVTGHNSPLYGRVGENAESALLNMDWTAKYWLRNGAPKHRLILGFGLYGRSFKLKNPAVNGMGALTVGAGRQGNYTKEAGFMSYFEVCEELKKGAVRVWDPEHKCPYLYKDDLWVGYDDEESIREKVKWLKDGGYGGVMVWSLALDDFSGTFCNQGRYPLLTMIKNELQKPAPVKPKSGTSVSKTNIGSKVNHAAMPPVVVSDRVQGVGNHANSGHQELTLPTGLSFKNHQQPRQSNLPNDLSTLSFGQNHAAHNIVPTQTQPLSPSSEIIAGQTKSAPLDTSVLINVPPSVAQIIPSTHPKNTAAMAAVHQDLPPLSPGTVLNQPLQNNLPVAAIQAINSQSPMIIPDIQPIQPMGSINIAQPASVGVMGGMPAGTIVDIANPMPPGLSQANLQPNVNSIPSAPIDAGMPLIIDANRMANGAVIVNAPVGPQPGIGIVDIAAQPSVLASAPQPPVALVPVIQAAVPIAPVATPAKPKVNFSFTSSSSSSSNSSSSSSNSSSSSTVELPQRVSIAQAIQNAIQGSPSDAVIITDLPSNDGIISTAQLGSPAAVPTIVAAPPTLQLGGGNAGAVIPVTSVSNLEELLSNLNTNLPTAGTILLPEPNNDLTPAVALRELSLGNALDSFGLGTARSAQQPRRQQPATRQVSIPAARPVLQSSFDPIQQRSSSSVLRPRSRGTATTGRNNRALIEAIRRNPALRARIIAARRRAQALAAARARSRTPFTGTSARSRSPLIGPSARSLSPSTGTSTRFRSTLPGRQIPLQTRSRPTRFQTTRTRSSQTLPMSELLRRRQMSRLPIQRSSGVAPVTRQTFSPRTRRRLSPAQVRAIRTFLARRSGSTPTRTMPRVVQRPTPTRFQPSRTFVSPTRSSIPRNILSQFRGLT